MEEASNYVKRKQGDYSMSLKLWIVREIEQGKLSTHATAQERYRMQHDQRRGLLRECGRRKDKRHIETGVMILTYHQELGTMKKMIKESIDVYNRQRPHY